MPDHDVAAAGSERERALGILHRHGRSSTSFQTLERGFSYRFDGDGFVAYRDTGRAWVAAGPPVVAPARLEAVARRFMREGWARGRRACFFDVEPDLLERAGLAGTAIGEEPLWDPGLWPRILAGSRGLREQLRRSRAKGVVPRVLGHAEVREGTELRAALHVMVARWLCTRRMAPMGFLVQVDPFDRPQERRYVLAERRGVPLALLVAVPVYGRGGWMVEHVFRDPAAPNGTTELTIDRFMRAAAQDGSSWVSLGLAPLSGELSAPLEAARRLGRRFYNFTGLRAFKAKLRPLRWEPRYLARSPSSSAVATLWDVLTAFTPVGVAAFAVATARHLRYGALCELPPQ